MGLGNIIAAICTPCGGTVKEPPKAAQCAVAGYDWGPADEEPAKEKPSQNGFPAPSEPAPTPDPEPAAPPKPPPKPAPTTPIVLETLQGDWVNSVGAKISVNGTEVSLNGMVMKVHPVMLNEDGTVSSVGRIWQLKGWLEDERIEFKEAPSKEVMEFARSVVWTKATEEKMSEWTTQMANLGYAGSSQDVKSRGVEGCCPGTCDAKAKIAADDADRDKAELKMLNDLIQQYRLKELKIVPPRSVIPDFSNRGHTGLSVEHVHYLATSFKEKGFQKRQGNKGHDIPVLVMESSSSELGRKSIENWRSKLDYEPGFPPKEHYERLFSQPRIYTSLGNGHFNQALNLFLNECQSIYGSTRYTIGSDEALREAVETGVSSIVLKGDIPLRDREVISRLLNSKREYKWNVGADGSVNILDATEDTSTCKQFEALSKVLDAVELNCLVRAELGVKDSQRIGQ
mmetsp:Transcript_82766/g.255825  ORF Transcript_82766/g.255825 Transcript_82766/m.255825 type:complete len:456 (-) Transcript_82766:29-1396(-)